MLMSLSARPFPSPSLAELRGGSMTPLSVDSFRALGDAFFINFAFGTGSLIPPSQTGGKRRLARLREVLLVHYE